MEHFDQSVSDKELLEDFVKRGHEDSFSVLVHHYKLRLFNVAFHVLNDRYAAEDVVQKVFMRLLERKNELASVESLKSWLYRTALNLSLNMKRSTRRREDREKSDETYPTPESPREGAARAELRTELDLALTKLKASLRIPLVLRYLEGLSYSEAGEIMEISSNAVRKRADRALKTLRKFLMGRGLLISVLVVKGGLRSLPAKAATAGFLTSASSILKAVSGTGIAAKVAVTSTSIINGGLIMTAKTKIAIGVGATVILASTVTYFAITGSDRGHRAPFSDTGAIHPPREEEKTTTGSRIVRPLPDEADRSQGFLWGKVVDAEGRGVAGAAVEAGVFEGDSPGSLVRIAFVQSMTTDVSGEFRFAEEEAFSGAKRFLGSDSTLSEATGPLEPSPAPPQASLHSLLVVSKDGYFPERLQVDLESPSGPHEIVLKKAPEVSGWVIWKETREPISRVKVTCTPQKSDLYQASRAETQTDEEGKFSVTISAEGDAKLWAEFVNAFQPEPKEPNVRLLPGEKITNFVLAVELLSDSVLEGRVLDQYRRPVAGAEVRLGRGQTMSPKTLSEEDGRYRLMVPRDWYYPSLRMSDWPGKPEIAKVSFTAHGASVEPADSSRRDLPNGTWDWAEYWTPPADAPPERIVAFHPDYELGIVEVPGFAVGQMRRGVDIILYQGSLVTGAVVDQNSQPLAGANINVKIEPQEGGVLMERDLMEARGHEDYVWVMWHRGVRAAENGAYEIRFLREGAYKLTASYSHCDDVIKRLELSPHQVVQNFDFILTTKTGSIRGKVLDERGNAWTHGTVWMRVHDIPGAPSLGTIYTAKVGEDGSYELSGLSYTFPGKYEPQLKVSDDCPEPAGILWAPPLSDIPAGAEGMNLVVREFPAGALRVRVVDGGNMPIENFKLESRILSLTHGENAIIGENYSIGDLGKEVVIGWVSDDGTGNITHGEERRYERAVVSESGEFLAERVAPGRYTVTVETPGGGRVSKEVEIGGAQQTEVLFQLEASYDQ